MLSRSKIHFRPVMANVTACRERVRNACGKERKEKREKREKRRKRSDDDDHDDKEEKEEEEGEKRARGILRNGLT